MRTRDTRLSGTNLGTARSAKQWRDSFARLPNSRVMASWTVLHTRRIAVVTPRRGSAARRNVPWSTRLENESSRKILYPPDLDPFRRTREWCKEAQGVAGVPGEWEGRERVGKRSALRGYRVNAPWMNDEPWGRPYLPAFAPACPQCYCRTFVTPLANSNRISSRCLVRSVELRLESS